MSFFKRLIFSLILLLLLGLLLSVTYYEPAQSLSSRSDEDQPAQQSHGVTAGEEARGIPVPQAPQARRAEG
jgi:hypothetical protein